MRSVDLHSDPRTAMHVRSLRGQVITQAGVVAWLGQPASFRVRATSGVVALDSEAIIRSKYCN